MRALARVRYGGWNDGVGQNLQLDGVAASGRVVDNMVALDTDAKNDATEIMRLALAGLLDLLSALIADERTETVDGDMVASTQVLRAVGPAVFSFFNEPHAVGCPYGAARNAAPPLPLPWRREP